ncbi:MAG: ribonuclease J [Clostridia bacterium]
MEVILAKKLKVIFLGGVCEIGKNMLAIEYGDNIIIVDSGSSFPTNETPGIDLVIPDFDYIVKNKDKVRGIFLTHGHEDHIGAVPFLLDELSNDVPIYASKLTLGLLTEKLKEHKAKKPKMIVVKGGNVVQLVCFSIEFIHMSHSILGALALAITTPIGVIFHTGDYKIDYTPIDGNMVDLNRIAQIGTEGVLLMLGESTNVERKGHTLSELAVGKTLDKLFASNKDSRIIVATFASNVHRVQQIVNLAEKFGRKVCFNGRSMLRIAEVAQNIGELTYNAATVIELEELSKFPPKQVCIISTGSQGEPMSALTRMASGDSSIVLSKEDTVIVSSSPIPGNERMVYNVINDIYRKGANVIYGSLEEIHASGHACRDELMLMLSLVKPKFFIPVHGEFRHLKQHAELAIEMGVKSENIQIPDLGNVFEITKKGLIRCENIESGNTYVDGITVGDVDSLILRDRKQLSNDGFVVAMARVSLESGKREGVVDIISRGFQFDDATLEEMKQIVIDIFDKKDYKTIEDRGLFKSKLRKSLNKYIYQKLKQRPMILPIIMEI